MRALNCGLLFVTALLLLSCAVTAGSHGSWGGETLGSCCERTAGRVDYHITTVRGASAVDLILVADGTSGGSYHGGSVPTGDFTATDGRVIKWECEARDGALTAVTVGGVRHDLTKGGLVLITARHGQTHIRQVTVDLARLNGKGPISLDTLKTAVADNLAVVAYLDAVGTPKPVPREPLEVNSKSETQNPKQ